MLRLTRNDASVGAFLLIALVALAGFIVMKAQNQGWATGTKRWTVQTIDGRNIKPDAPVRMRGIQVGVVETIDMDPKTAAITIGFRVEPRYAPTVRTNAQVSIMEPPLLGVTYLDLDPGNTELAEMQSGGTFKEFEQPTLMNTVENSVLKVETILRRTDEAIGKANDALASVAKITTDIAQGEGFVSRMIKDQQISNDLKKTIANVALVSEDLTDVTGGLRRREGTIGRILKSDQVVVETEKLLQKTRESLASLDAVTDRLTKSVEQVATRLDQTGGSVEGLKDVVENTKKITAELALLAKNINQGKGSVGKLLNDDAVYVEAKGLLRELRETIQDLREQAPINSFIGVVFSAF